MFKALERSACGSGKKCLRLWREVLKAMERSV